MAVLSSEALASDSAFAYSAVSDRCLFFEDNTRERISGLRASLGWRWLKEREDRQQHVRCKPAKPFCVRAIPVCGSIAGLGFLPRSLAAPFAGAAFSLVMWPPSAPSLARSVAVEASLPFEHSNVPLMQAARIAPFVLGQRVNNHGAGNRCRWSGEQRS